VTSMTRPPIESLRPVASFAVVRVLLAAAALLADAILSFPSGATLPLLLACVAIPWSLAALVLARTTPMKALTPAVAAGDLAVVVVIQAAVPETYAATHFAALLFIGAHAHFQGQRRGVLIAGLGAAALIAATVARKGPVTRDMLAYYETVFAVTALAMAAVIGELRGVETAGRLRARELSRRTIVGEDEVRRKVADFIHDGPVQELIGLDMLLEGAIRASQRGDGERAGELLTNSRELVEGNIRALRDEIVNLGPYAFEELSFEIAVERSIPVWKRRFDCDVTVDGNVDLDPTIAGDLFRITQEAVANACKHGEATRVDVALASDGDTAGLRITDNGIGFGDIDPLGPHEPGHIGLASIRERAELLDGTLSITSKAGETVIEVRVPLGGSEQRPRPSPSSS
jgi:signal transduction histidine kinase